jgi:hydrogenase maturation protease
MVGAMDGSPVTRRQTVVIGAGNVLRGDDGVGVRVAQALVEGGVPEGVEVIDAGTRGLDLLFEIEGADQALLIDAADMGQAPGTARLFGADQLAGEPDVRFASLHGFGVAEVLALARALGMEPRMTILGIQPADVGGRESLSEALAARLPEYVALARGKLVGTHETCDRLAAGQGSDISG